MTDRDLYLGQQLDAGERLLLDADHLTTHAVCLGMTGSGKTGLGVVAMEELARRRVPLLVVDLKGDMVNLLLSFPSLAATDFEPWLPADELARGEPSAMAAEVAARWRSGLEGSGLGPDDVRAVGDGLDWQLITPGVASAAPLDILPTLSVPQGWDVDADPDASGQRVNGVASALLELVDRGGDPLTSRDHVLISTILLEHWRQHEPVDLVKLLKSIADPPMESFGALPLETFYPRDDRMKLVLELNTLVASPAFAAWTRGTPLAMESLIGTPEAPRGTVVTVAHLDRRQRTFVLSLLLSELVAWMGRQPASAGLRALLYLDEVQGLLPPHPANPPTKGPLMTLLKQGRAFGVGVWLATQNPVDLDYKALGNAGVKLVGRLITDRDRERALEGLGMHTLEDGRDADDVVAGLGKREFLLHDVRAEPRTQLFSSRWAMSYLRGPVTLAEMDGLLQPTAGNRPEPSTAARAPAPPSAQASAAEPPLSQATIPVRFAQGPRGLCQPSLLVRGRVAVERKTLGLERRQDEAWHIPVAADGGLDWEAAVALGEVPELHDEPLAGMEFPTTLPSRLDAELERAESEYVIWRARQPVEVMANPKLKAAAEPGESREAFVERCYDRADRADDARQDAVRARYERRMETLRRRLDREHDELERDRTEAESRKVEEKLGVVEGLFSVLLGSRGVRSAARKAASRARTAAGKRRMRQRAEASVEESVREIDRLERDLEDLALEMQDEVDRIAMESEDKAEAVEVVAVRPKRADVEVLEVVLVWGL